MNKFPQTERISAESHRNKEIYGEKMVNVIEGYFAEDYWIVLD